MTSPAYQPVENFERAMAAFIGADYGVAVESCSMALFLACLYHDVQEVEIPARTYISVPAAIIHAGGRVKFREVEWSGMYRLEPYPIYDAALRLRQDMYVGGLQCLSFHARKLLPIGRGGMILTDNPEAANWLRRMRFDGRDGSVPFMEDQVSLLGYNAYMTPEQAARGLQLLENLPSDLPDLPAVYPDLRKLPVFAHHVLA